MAMNLQQLVSKYNGQTVEAGGSANALNQCVDLANAYIRDCFGRPILLGTNAADFPTRLTGDYEVIKNTPDFVPQVGDMGIWGKPIGKYIANGVTYYAGHISIVVDPTVAPGAISPDLSHFSSFDQNWPTGSPCHVQQHDYSYVTHFIRPKGIVMPDTTMQIEKLVFEKLVGNSGKWDSTVRYVELPTDPATTSFEDVQRVIGGYKSRGTDLQNQLNIATSELRNREEQVSRLKDQLTNEQNLNSELAIKLKKALEIQGDATTLLEGRIAALQRQVDDISIEKGALNTKLTAALQDAESWKIKYNELLTTGVKANVTLWDAVLILAKTFVGWAQSVQIKKQT